LKIKDASNLTPVKSLTKFLSPSKIRDKVAEYNKKLNQQRKGMLREVTESITNFENRDDLMSPSGSHTYFVDIFAYSNKKLK
jgi:hypothetical protein